LRDKAALNVAAGGHQAARAAQRSVQAGRAAAEQLHAALPPAQRLRAAVEQLHAADNELVRRECERRVAVTKAQAWRRGAQRAR
jgi:hypothetical protein